MKIKIFQQYNIIKKSKIIARVRKMIDSLKLLQLHLSIQ